MDQRKRNCIFNCHISGITLHRFPNPNKYPDAFAEWINAVGDRLSAKDTESIYKNKRICARHFLPEHKTTGHKLLKCARPTLNLTGVPQSLLTIIDLDHNYCCRVVPGKMDSSPPTHLAINATSSTSQTGTSETDSPNEERHEISVEYNPAVRDSLDAEVFDSYDDVTIEEVPPDPPKEFSWQDPEATVDLAQDEDGRVPVAYNEENLSLYCSDDDKDRIRYMSNEGTEEHAGFQCDSCAVEITGYRYTCVQCNNYDLCASCEASGVHDLHYVLRVPGPRPAAEVQRMLARIRSHLSAVLNPISNEDDNVSIKCEIKDENEEPFSEKSREDIWQNNEEVFKEKRDSSREVAKEAEMSQEENVLDEADPLRTDDGWTDTVIHSDKEWVPSNKNHSAESSDNVTNENIFTSGIPIRPPLTTKRIPRTIRRKDMLSAKTKKMQRLVTPSLVQDGRTLKKLTELGINMDDSRLRKRTIIVKKSDYEKLLKAQPCAKRVRVSLETAVGPSVNTRVVMINPTATDKDTNR